MQDFNYVFSNCFEITLELSCCKYPSASTLQTEWENNRESLIHYMEAVHLGIKGLVTDEETGEAIRGADVTIRGIEYDVKTTSNGEYWRLLLPGTYSVLVTATGYRDNEIHSVSVTDKNTTVLNFKMKRSAPDIPEIDLPIYYEFGHHNYVEMEALLKNITEAYPTITRLYTVGQTVQGRELYVGFKFKLSVKGSINIINCLIYRYWKSLIIQASTKQASQNSNISLTCKIQFNNLGF